MWWTRAGFDYMDIHLKWEPQAEGKDALGLTVQDANKFLRASCADWSCENEAVGEG